MKNKYNLLLLTVQIFLIACGNVDFTAGSGFNVSTLAGLNLLVRNNSAITPNAPANLQATTIGTDKIDLVWENDYNNVTGFRIDRSAGTNSNFNEIAGAIKGSASSYNDTTGLNPGTTYYYRIRAYNNAGNSAYSNNASATTYTTEPLTPYSPSILQATSVSSSQINLSWNDNSDNETGFSIERSTDNSNYGQITTASANATSYNNTGLAPNTTYYYRVRAYNGSGNSGYSNTSSATTGNVVPASPSGLTATAMSSYSINLGWADNSTNETSFIIQRSANNVDFVNIASVAANTTAYSDSNSLSASTQYYYRVWAHNGIGDSTGYGEATATTLASNPTGTAIIADHTIVSRYTSIPDQYIALVKKMLLIIPGESHSRSYTRGLQLLAQENSRYNCLISDSPAGAGMGPSVTTYLRASNYYYNADYEGGKYKGNCSEHDFWSGSTNISTASNMIRQSILYQLNTQSNPISAIGFGWCWDMAFNTYYSPSVDAVYGVHWFGATDGELGTTPGVWWGLDSGDSAICMDTYIAVIQSLMQVNSGTIVFFTTGPIDSSPCEGESGYQNYIKHQYIREKVASIEGAVLFDFADILTYNDAGSLNTVTWNGHTHPFIHPDNEGTDTIDYHFGTNGAKRLAKAMWWMLARIAGWDGN